MHIVSSPQTPAENGRTEQMDPTFIIILLVMLGFFWLMSAGTRKVQKKQLEQQRAAIVLGNNVITNSGFFGRIVDIDGDAVTLESPAGDETVWLKRSIMAQMDIPFAEISEAEALAADEATESAPEEAAIDSKGETDAATQDDFRGGADESNLRSGESSDSATER